MQCPPTMPGWWICEYGWLLAAAMTSWMSTPTRAVAGELVRQGDVHVAIGGVGELAELGRFRVRHCHDLGVEDGVVEGRSAGGRGRAEPADELRVGREVAERRAAVQPLRREGDEEVLVCAKARDRFETRGETTAGVADGKRRLEDDDDPAWMPGPTDSTAASM